MDHVRLLTFIFVVGIKCYLALIQVTPPADVNGRLLQQNSVEIIWSSTNESQFSLYYLTLVNNSGNHTIALDAYKNTTILTGLKQDELYTVLLSKGMNNGTHQFHASDPLFVATNGSNSICNGGVFVALLKVNGESPRFTWTSTMWKSAATLNEKLAWPNIPEVEAKTEYYAKQKVKRICLGVGNTAPSPLQWISYQMGQTQSSQTLMQLMAGKYTSVNTVGLPEWEKLFKVKANQRSCLRAGFVPGCNSARARFGILLNNENECLSCDSCIGIGIRNLAGTELSCGMLTIRSIRHRRHCFLMATTFANGTSMYNDEKVVIVKSEMWVRWKMEDNWNSGLCPKAVDAVCDPWSSWTPCSKTCGIGTKERSRNCSEAYNEGMILGTEEVNKCQLEECPFAAPENLTAKNTSSTSIHITWSRLQRSDFGTGELQKYIIILTASDGTTIHRNSPRSNTKTHIFALKIFHTYTVQIRAVSEERLGNLSSPVIVTTDEEAPIGFPTHLTFVNSSSHCVRMKWNETSRSLSRGYVLGSYLYFTQQKQQKQKQQQQQQQRDGPIDGPIDGVIGGVISDASDEKSENKQKVQGLEDKACNLQPFTNYTVQISIYNKKGEGPKGPQIPVQAWTDEYVPKSAPSEVYGKNTSSTSVLLRWSSLPLTEWNGIPRSYVIYYSKSKSSKKSNSTVVVYPTITTTIENLEVFTQYWIKVAGGTVKGPGKQSKSIVVTTDESVPIGAPKLLWAQNISSTEIALQILPPPLLERRGILLGYIVNVNSSTNPKVADQVLKITEVTISIKGLQHYHEYLLNFATFTRKGLGIFSSEYKIKTDEYVPTAPPRNLKIANSSTVSLTMSWESITPDHWNGIPRGYVVKWKSVKQGANWNTVKMDNLSTFYTIRGLQPYKNYTITVAGFTIKGVGGFTNESMYQSEEEEPLAPQKTKVQVSSSDSIGVYWEHPPSTQNHGELLGYSIYYKPVYNLPDLSVPQVRPRRSLQSGYQLLQRETKVVNIPPDKTSATLTGLYGNTNYSISISCYAAKESELVTMYVRTKENVPLIAPHGVKVFPTSHTSLRVEWKYTPPALMQGKLVFFNVYFKESKESVYKNETQSAKHAHLDITHLKPFTQYNVYVASSTAVGESREINIVNATTNGWYPSKAPSDVKASRYFAPTTIKVTWTTIDPEAWRGVPQGFIIQFKEYSVGDVVQSKSKITQHYVPVTSTSFVLNSANVYTTYDIQIAAYTSVGQGPWSLTTYGKTCNLESPHIDVAWLELPGFSVLNTTTSKPEGMLIQLLKDGMHSCAGPCQLFGAKYQVIFNFANLNLTLFKHVNQRQQYQPLLSAQRSKILLPSLSTRHPPPDIVHLSLIETEFAALFRRKLGTVLISVGSAVGGSFVAPIVLLMLACIVVGSLFWIMERHSNPDDFSPSFISGIADGFFYSYVTATTVGYGEPVTRTILGRLATIIWALCGIVFVGVIVGALNTQLVAKTVVLQKSAESKSQIALLPGTIEDYIFKFLNNRYSDFNGSTYEELFTLSESVGSDFVLMDALMGASYQHFAHEHNFVFYKKLPYSAPQSVGMQVTGNFTKLKTCFEQYLKASAQSAAFMIQDMSQSDDDHAEPVTPISEEMKVISIKSEIYQKTLIGVLVLTAVATILGLGFHFWNTKIHNRSSIAKIMPTESSLVRVDENFESIEKFILQFRKSINRCFEHLDQKHWSEIKALQALKYKIYGKYQQHNVDSFLEEVAMFNIVMTAKEKDTQVKVPVARRQGQGTPHTKD